MNGNKYCQIFANRKGWEFNYPMKLTSESPIALTKAFKEFGLPEVMVTDRAPELIDGEWGNNQRPSCHPQDDRSSVTMAK
jgi:hypothetical protein